MSPEAESVVSASAIRWDTEERHQLLPREAVLRGTTMYIGAPLLQWMEDTWGGVLSFIKTSTHAESGEVLVAKAQPGEPGAVALRRVGTQNAAELSFWRPLRKLNIKVPARREFVLTPRLLKVDDTLTVFVFAVNERVSRPRGTSTSAEAEAATAADPRATSSQS